MSARCKAPAWRVLVDRGYFQDRKTAEAWIMAGQVLADDERVAKAGYPLPIAAEIRVRGRTSGYVSRGGLKLAGALEDLALSVENATCIDCGASTGGFTDCLLQHGARMVYAVDVGYGQLAGKLRSDPRVVNLERTNIADLSRTALDPVPDLAVVDLSYLSLQEAVPQIAGLVSTSTVICCLVKPLFEVRDSSLRRSGRIREPATYVEVLEDLASGLHARRLPVSAVAASRERGSGGTIEFFLLIRPYGPLKEYSVAAQIRNAVRTAVDAG